MQSVHVGGEGDGHCHTVIITDARLTQLKLFFRHINMGIGIEARSTVNLGYGFYG